MTYTELMKKVRTANLVLVGLGESLSGDLERFYRSLAVLLKGKDYFVVTLKERSKLEEAGLLAEQIVAPLEEGEDSKNWERYLHWLGFTLHQKLCILELGVGFLHPSLIRFPFEKTCYFNQKSIFIRIHETLPQLSAEIAERGIAIQENPVLFLTAGEEAENDRDH